MTFAAVLLLAIFITGPVFSQETAKKESSKKVIIKIISDDNGTTTMMDTIMDIPDSMMSESVNEEIHKEVEDVMLECMPPGGQGCEMSAGRHPRTLNDFFGEIPMERVVSYSIRDRKGGKRIIIDLNDAPIFERPNNVIVIREPGRINSRMHHPEHQVKVVVNSDDSVPPPPPPPDKKSK